MQIGQIVEPEVLREPLVHLPRRDRDPEVQDDPLVLRQLEMVRGHRGGHSPIAPVQHRVAACPEKTNGPTGSFWREKFLVEPIIGWI